MGLLESLPYFTLDDIDSLGPRRRSRLEELNLVPDAGLGLMIAGVGQCAPVHFRESDRSHDGSLDATSRPPPINGLSPRTPIHNLCHVILRRVSRASDRAARPGQLLVSAEVLSRLVSAATASRCPTVKFDCIGMVSWTVNGNGPAIETRGVYQRCIIS